MEKHKCSRVLILASAASMIEQFNRENIRILLELGYWVDVSCNFEEGNTCSDQKIKQFRQELEAMGVRCIQTWFSRNVWDLRREIDAYIQVKKLCRDNHYAFIHCHSPIGGVIGRIAARQTQTKVVYTAHGFHFFRGAFWINWILFYPVEKLLSYGTDVLITINREDYSLAKRKFRAKKTLYVPGAGICTQNFKNTGKTREAVRKKLGIGPKDILLVSIGELNRNKNHELAVRALEKLRRDAACAKISGNLHYAVCGIGMRRAWLEKLSRKLGLEHQVHFLGYREDIADILAASDIFLSLSKREGLPVSLMEAMAAGLPCIVTKVRGNTDLIKDGIDGYVTGYHAQDVSEAVKKLLFDEKTGKRMSANVRRHAAKFDISRVSAAMKKTYRMMDEGKKQSGFYSSAESRTIG